MCVLSVDIWDSIYSVYIVRIYVDYFWNNIDDVETSLGIFRESWSLQKILLTAKFVSIKYIFKAF